MDTTATGGSVHVDDASILYPAAASNTMTFAFWMKKYDAVNCSAFWVSSPSSTGTGRGFHAHLPYSTSIYFDTAGCCDAGLNRISQVLNSANFPPYVDSFWTNGWHHWAFVFNAGTKEVYIDGTWFFSGYNSAPLPLDFSDMYIGRDPSANVNIHGIMDDFAAFGSALTADSVTALFNGTAPSALAGERLLAFWNFNDAPLGPPTIRIAKSGNSLVITYSGTLQSATDVRGPYNDVSGANNPYTLPDTSAPQRFYRTRP